MRFSSGDIINSKSNDEMYLVTVLLVYETGLHAVQFGNNWMKNSEVCNLAVQGILYSIIPKFDKHIVTCFNYVSRMWYCQNTGIADNSHSLLLTENIYLLALFQGYIHQPKFCLPFMQPGRLIQVKNELLQQYWLFTSINAYFR